MRDLLIYVVHGFSRREYKTYTPFVSTTPDFKRARSFAGKHTNQQTGNPCVICLFLPFESKFLVFHSNKLKSESQKKLELLGLPPLEQTFFNEKEVAFFGAIYPLLIYAVADLKSKKVFWNPAVFDIPLDANAEIWRIGFPIDQRDFPCKLKQTDYAKGIERSAAGDSEIVPK